ncbi:MAG: hypothetical protein M5U15_14620 [Kiritimatiellae bacterium]|nr:hypothetical protein [Kiritimatiellia bacterium]
MRSKKTILIIVSAAGLGALLAAAASKFLSDTPSVNAWLFGVALGLFQSLVGIALYQRAMARPDGSLLLSVGSGVFRLVFLLFALALAIRLGLPASAAAVSLLSMCLLMMLAEIVIVARESRILRQGAA